MLCSSVHVEQTQMMEIPEAAVLMDQFAGRGLDFIVDIGQRVRALCCTPSCSRQLLCARPFPSRGPDATGCAPCLLRNDGFDLNIILLFAGGRGFYCDRYDRLRTEARQDGQGQPQHFSPSRGG